MVDTLIYEVFGGSTKRQRPIESNEPLLPQDTFPVMVVVFDAVPAWGKENCDPTLPGGLRMEIERLFSFNSTAYWYTMGSYCWLLTSFAKKFAVRADGWEIPVNGSVGDQCSQQVRVSATKMTGSVPWEIQSSRILRIAFQKIRFISDSWRPDVSNGELIILKIVPPVSSSEIWAKLNSDERNTILRLALSIFIEKKTRSFFSRTRRLLITDKGEQTLQVFRCLNCSICDWNANLSVFTDAR